MKRLCAFILCLCSVPVMYSQSASEKITVTIKAGKFSLNKVYVTDDWKLDAVADILGSEERKKDGYNITHTYDNYGIVLFEKTEDKIGLGKLIEIQFCFSAGEVSTVTPSDLFRGSMQVEQLKITRDLTPTVLRAQLKNYTESDSYTAHSFRLASKGLYIYFMFNPEETRLVKMSIGPDTRSN